MGCAGRIIETNKLRRFLRELQIWWRGYVKTSLKAVCPYCGFQASIYARIYLVEQTGTDTLICVNCKFERDLTINELVELMKKEVS
jgi:transcription elongation factor Elf1